VYEGLRLPAFVLNDVRQVLVEQDVPGIMAGE
jgi:hypothetical protein